MNCGNASIRVLMSSSASRFCTWASISRIALALVSGSKANKHASPWVGGLPANASPQFVAKKSFGSAGGFDGGHKMPGSEGSDREETEEEAKKRRKKEKKEKKKRKAAAAEEDGADVEEKPKKKKKKAKKEDSEDEAEFTAMKKNIGVTKGGAAVEAGDGTIAFRKDFYKEHPKVKNMSQSEVDAHRKKWVMDVSGEDCDFKPCAEFEWLNVGEKVSYNPPPSTPVYTLRRAPLHLTRSAVPR